MTEMGARNDPERGRNDREGMRRRIAAERRWEYQENVVIRAKARELGRRYGRRAPSPSLGMTSILFAPPRSPPERVGREPPVVERRNYPARAGKRRARRLTWERAWRGGNAADRSTNGAGCARAFVPLPHSLPCREQPRHARPGDDADRRGMTVRGGA